MPWFYRGFSEPNYTQIPDDFFDEVMCHLTEAELRVCLYILRRTFGFKKRADTISFNQFLKGIETSDGRRLDSGCGVRSSSSVSAALSGLEEKGIIRRAQQNDPKAGKRATLYELRFADAPLLRETQYPTAATEVGGTVAAEVALLRQSKIQETGSQETVDQETGKALRVSNADPIEKLMIQVSHDLGDGAHTRSNISRLWNLVEDHGNVSDDDVTRILREAYHKTRDANARNPIAYCFTLIEQQLTLIPKKQSLAGRYSHLVQH